MGRGVNKGRSQVYPTSTPLELPLSASFPFPLGCDDPQSPHGIQLFAAPPWPPAPPSLLSFSPFQSSRSMASNSVSLLLFRNPSSSDAGVPSLRSTSRRIDSSVSSPLASLSSAVSSRRKRSRCVARNVIFSDAVVIPCGISVPLLVISSTCASRLPSPPAPTCPRAALSRP